MDKIIGILLTHQMIAEKLFLGMKGCENDEN